MKLERPSLPKPEWLKVSFRLGANQEVATLMDQLGLHTVCREANCPNLSHCYARKTATFMILGKFCSRNCPFCNVHFARPEPVDPEEPAHVAEAAARLHLRYVVLTSVTRDDLPDGGTGQFVAVITALRRKDPSLRIEVLVPDFQGEEMALQAVLAAGSHVLNHNVETVEELYARVRPAASYSRSLTLLRRAKEYALQQSSPLLLKMGLMLGLGETEEQLRRLFADLVETGCDILTLGQYLQPSPAHLPVEAYLSPEDFEHYRQLALQAGLRSVVAGPLVRSSYEADQVFSQVVEG